MTMTLTWLDILMIFIAGFGGGILGSMLYLHLNKRWEEHQMWVLAHTPPGPREPDEEPVGPPALEGQPERERYGKCQGCGVADDQWCKRKCRYYDRWDTGVRSE